MLLFSNQVSVLLIGPLPEFLTDPFRIYKFLCPSRLLNLPKLLKLSKYKNYLY